MEKENSRYFNQVAIIFLFLAQPHNTGRYRKFSVYYKDLFWSSKCTNEIDIIDS
jgi:hypothetical protein